MFEVTPKSYVIASPMEGVLLKDGKPLPRAKIIRTLKWNGNEEGLITEHYTDDEGKFSLPIHKEELALGILDQFVGKMMLDVELGGKVYELWYNSTFSEGDESGGPIEGLVCDIGTPEVVFNIGINKFMTRCRWAGMPADFVATGE